MDCNTGLLMTGFGWVHLHFPRGGLSILPCSKMKKNRPLYEAVSRAGYVCELR